MIGPSSYLRYTELCKSLDNESVTDFSSSNAQRSHGQASEIEIALLNDYSLIRKSKKHKPIYSNYNFNDVAVDQGDETEKKKRKWVTRHIFANYQCVEYVCLHF